MFFLKVPFPLVGDNEDKGMARRQTFWLDRALISRSEMAPVTAVVRGSQARGGITAATL